MKKITVMLFVLSLFGLFSTSMIAQNTPAGMTKKAILKNQFQQMAEDGHDHIAETPGPDGVVRCATDQYEEMLQRQNPDRQTREEFEAWLAPKIAQIKADIAAGRNVQAVYNIPVVIHVIHSGGDPVGTQENISDAQAASQIQVLNNDFRRLAGTNGFNTNPVGADVEINFCLAQQDPTGVASTGIEHLSITPPNNHPARTDDWETTADINAMKATTIWDTSRYMNFWSVRFGGETSANGGTSDLLGYAQFPNGSSLGDLPGNDGGANNNTDGAVCVFNAFGNKNDPSNVGGNTFNLNPTYNLGRTMTHEVGHWLGLYHTFQGGCTGVGDRCTDTPAIAAPNFGCATGTNSCPSAAGNDMVENYMDYSDDACMNIFTADQKIRVQAVMASAQRRASLNASTVCQTATPVIKFGATTGSINENTNCNFTDVTFPVFIGKAPSQPATITFANSGSATTAVDYQIMTASLNFPTGSTAAQDMTVRVFHDGLVEGNETINVSLVLNANGGDATLDPVAKDIIITIADDDVIPSGTVNTTILSSDFESAAGYSIIDGDGDGENWGTITGAEGIGAILGACAFSETDLTIAGGTGTAIPNNYIITPQVTIPAGITSGEIKYDIGYFTQGAGAGEHYAVYFTTSIASEAAILAGTTLQADTITPANFTTAPKSHSILGLAGQTGYFVFRHIANASGDGIILLDNLDVSTVVAKSVQTTVNTPTAYTGGVTGNGTAYASDTTTGNLILSITDSDNFNYGCATVSVSRDATTAGAATVNYGTNTAPDLKVMAKSFTIATVNSNPTGAATITFYFTEAEIASWEAGTGNVRADLKVLKQTGTYTASTLGTFGSDITLSTTLTNGADGVYYFGKQAPAAIPMVSFAAATATETEATDCTFTDYTYPILLDIPATADATITFNVTPGTATAALDYQIVNPSVVFPAGTTTAQNLTVRVFNDGLVEANETINVSLSITTSGDAVIDTTKDDMVITINDNDPVAATTATIQDVVNTATAYNVSVNATGTINATDTTSGNLILSLNNTTAFDYGCSAFSVSRDAVTAGGPAVNFGTNVAVNQQVLAKALTITTANANATGTADVTFYFTESEVAAWEAATGNVRANLKMIKTGETAYSNVTVATFGSNVSLTAALTTGFTGEFNFGAEILPTISFAAATATETEATDCTFTDYTYPILLDIPATADATITFNVTPGTATAALDYQIVNPSVVFPAGTTTAQNLTVRVFNDGLVEANETINVSLSITTSGDAVLDATKDDMVITINDNDIAPIATTPIQDVVNTATAYSATINATGTAHAIDSVSGNVMLSLTDNDNFDYGCSTISVSRDATTAGAPSVNFGANTATNLQVMAKVFTVATTNANATGSATNTFYFTESEIAAWETATGNLRSALKVIKLGETTYASATIGSFGATGVTLTATTSTGAAGDYHFGIDANPTISFDNATGTALEATDCSFTDVTFPISILTAATADATVTFNVTGGTATTAVDYQIVNPSVTFLAGTTTSQDLTVRIFNDGIVEADETINVTLVLNANGGDAVLDAAKKDIVVTITDNDIAPIPTTPIQDVVNTATAYTAAISQTGTAHATDSATGNVMLSLTNNDTFDYGCTTISVSRDGAPQNFGTNTDANLQVTGKVYSVTTANANPTGSVAYTFYFTEAEIAAWETATGNARTALKVIKLGQTTYTNAVLGTFGATGVSLTATFTEGASGDYHFGANIIVNPLISFNAATGVATEATNCNFTDVTFPISIDNAASANADITFNVTGSTATAGDYQIIPASVSFAAGSTTSQNMTVRVFHDGLVEGAETINVTLVLNANGGDAALDATKQDMVITINDDDLTPTAGGTVTLLSEDFESVPDWGVIDGDGDTNNWGTVTGAEGVGAILGACGFSETDLTIVGGTGTATPNNYIITPQVTIPAGASSATMNYDIGYFTQAAGPGEHYEVYFTTDATSEASILAGVVLQPNTITPANFTTAPISHDLVAAGIAGQTGFFVIRHLANPDGDGIILLDNMEITATTSGAAVQTTVNTPTAYVAGVTGTGTAYATDSVSGNIMLSLTNNTGFNYGCTTVSVSRIGAPQNFGANTATNLQVMGKNFTVAANANPSGSVGFTFYFTNAEITAWETATGNVRADLKVIKTGQTTYYPVTLGTFGSDITITTTIPDGADGIYNFGVDPALGTSTFELNNNISIYPNPTKDVLNISTTADFGLPTSYTIFSALGQVIKSVNKVSERDLTISTSSYSNGVYFIKIEKDGTFITKKFIKN